jgi:hypothetical protein
MPKELMGVFQLRMAMAWQRVDSVEAVTPWFLRDSPGFDLIPELVPRATEAVFDKITMSVFESTPLDIVLRDCGVNAFAIVGVATEVGIEPTVCHGADLGYIPVVVTDACAGGDEKAARRAVEGLEYTGDALFTDTATFLPHPAWIARRRGRSRRPVTGRARNPDSIADWAALRQLSEQRIGAGQLGVTIRFSPAVESAGLSTIGAHPLHQQHDQHNYHRDLP